MIYRAATTPVIALSLSLAVSGCTLLQADVTTCQDDAACRRAFGPGATCQEDGYCEPAAVEPRCARTFPADLLTQPERYKDAIVIGASFDYQAHLDTLQASELVFREVSSASQNGLDGRQLALISCDYGNEETYGDGLDSEQAASQTAQYLSETFDVPAIIGPRGSSRTIAVFNAVKANGVLVISPSATSPALTPLEQGTPSDDAPGLLWRTAPPDSVQGQVIAEDVVRRSAERVRQGEEPIRKILILQQLGAYGDGLREVFEETLRAQGSSITAQTLFFGSEEQSELNDVIGQALNVSDADEYLFISSDLADIRTFVGLPNLSQSIGDRVIFLPDSAFNNDLVDDVSSQIYANLRGTRPSFDLRSPAYISFLASYRNTFNEDASQASAFTPHAYDAAWLVLYGVAWSSYQRGGDITGRHIAQGIRRASKPASGRAPIEVKAVSWGAVTDAFSKGIEINVQGASGDLDYNARTEELVSPIQIWTVGTQGDFVQDPQDIFTP